MKPILMATTNNASKAHEKKQMILWHVCDVLDKGHFGIVNDKDEIIIGAQSHLTKEQVEKIVYAHNSEEVYKINPEKDKYNDKIKKLEDDLYEKYIQIEKLQLHIEKLKKELALTHKTKEIEGFTK